MSAFRIFQSKIVKRVIGIGLVVAFAQSLAADYERTSGHHVESPVAQLMRIAGHATKSSSNSSISGVMRHSDTGGSGSHSTNINEINLTPDLNPIQIDNSPGTISDYDEMEEPTAIAEEIKPGQVKPKRLKL